MLIAKKSVFKNPVPGGCGGGTVLFVSAGYLYVNFKLTKFVILKGRPEFYVLGTMTEKCAYSATVIRMAGISNAFLPLLSGNT